MKLNNFLSIFGAISLTALTYPSSVCCGYAKNGFDSFDLHRVIDNNNYIWEGTFNDYDDSEGDKYAFDSFNLAGETMKFSCSAFRQNEFVGRNCDWEYVEKPHVIIHTPNNPSKNRFASVGVCFSHEINGFHQGNFSKTKFIPFFLSDGINEKGFFACVNEISDKHEEEWIPDSSKPKMISIRTVRYLVDHASSVDDVIDLLNQYSIYTLPSIGSFHLMVADASGKSGVVEFEWADETKTTKIPKLYLNSSSEFKNVFTNFTFTGYQGDCKNWTDPNSSLDPHAAGCERYNLIDDWLSKNTLSSLDDVQELLKQVYYSKSYTIELKDNSPDFWYSEFNDDLVKNSPHTVANYKKIVDEAKEKFEKRVRGSTGWYLTAHSCAYDLDKKELKVIFEEKDQVNKIIKINYSC